MRFVICFFVGVMLIPIALPVQLAIVAARRCAS